MSERASRKYDYSTAQIFSPSPATTIPAPDAPGGQEPVRYGESLGSAFKYFFDVILALVALICLAPLLAFTAVAIKLDSPGPIIFRQYRIGRDGNRFIIYKFRTMTVMENGHDVPQARREDPRVTKIGRLLRRSSIDELPQLLNVLKGDMSLVGPRPHAVSHDIYYAALIADYAERRRVKPGITGWAQVNGVRGETATIDEMRRRIKFDLWYVGNRSFLLDLRIMWRTCFEIARWTAY
jgi:putative colanic acid biosysnthesis UDP-glucose lipid carrier transferase